MSRKIVIALALALAAAPAAAEDAADTVKKLCASYAGFAKDVATDHQNGTALATVLDRLEQAAKDAGKEQAPILESIIIEIYDGPRYGTAVNQARAVAEVRDIVHVQCLKKFRQVLTTPAAGPKHRI